MIATKTEEIRDLKETSNTLIKWALGILGALATAGIIGNVAMYGQMRDNTRGLHGVEKRLDRIEDTQHEILMELRK